MTKKQTVKQIVKAIESLNESRNMDYTKSIVVVNKEEKVSVECERSDTVLTDESGEIVLDNRGMACYFQVYYQVNGEDTDCVSFFELNSTELERIQWLVGCWFGSGKRKQTA